MGILILAAACGSVVIGAQGAETIGAHEFAAWADLIPYEVLCAISKRVPRVMADAPPTG